MAPPPVAKQYALRGGKKKTKSALHLEDSIKDRYKVRRAFQYIGSVFAQLEKYT